MLAGAQFDGARLTGSRFEAADLRQAKFAGAEIENAYFKAAQLGRANLRAAKLNNASFDDAHLELTMAGDSVLAGAEDHVTLSGIDRYEKYITEAINPGKRRCWQSNENVRVGLARGGK